MFLRDMGVLGKTATKNGWVFFVFLFIYLNLLTIFFLLLDYVYMSGHHTFVHHHLIPM